jgi:uncharacterized protein (DUF2236 family)
MHDARAFPVARKINREAVVLLGWGRAILLQLAHPLVAAGVGDYSGFRSGARGFVRRVRGTVGGMLDLTFGTADEAQRFIDRINGIHDRVNGRLPATVGIFPAGTPYSARDPKLLLWVHATLSDSMTVAYETFVGPLTAEEKDTYTTEACWVPIALGVPDADVPRRFADVQTFMSDLTSRGEIAVSDEARKLSAALFSPPLGPAAARFRLSRTITVGLLPDEVRTGYGFPWGPRESRNFRRAVTLMRRTRRILPPMLREWPSARALKPH